VERSFTKEIAMLRLGAGQEFHGEGILAVTKGLLQAGVAYVGGYQGAPVSHLLDVLVQARDLLDELGIHVEACSNEASAAAMLGASIHYPIRGAVTWKSIVGTNVASDALSNLASVGVTGGALIVVGEDYGEGASVIQERTHAVALKSSLILFDPRPNLDSMVRMTEEAFAISETASTPVLLQLRIRTCHLRGHFTCKDNQEPVISRRSLMSAAAPFNYEKLSHPPATFRQEKLKTGQRLPAARDYILNARLNECFAGTRADAGIIVQGGLYNTLIRAMQQLGLADESGTSSLPILVLNVTYPLVPAQLREFSDGKRAVIVIEEGQPEFIEQEVLAVLKRGDLSAVVHGKDFLQMAGEYTVDVIARGLAGFLSRYCGDLDLSAGKGWLDETAARRQDVAKVLGALPARPPQFCVGCPERPVFSALKQLQADHGALHVSADIGCHSFATFEPFSQGHSILGYGMSLASAAGVGPMMTRRPLAIMGDGGFWHNGLLSGVQSALFNGGDVVLLILKNGYTSATGTQEIISSPTSEAKDALEQVQDSAAASNTAIEDTLRGMGVQWLRTVHTYHVDEMKGVLDEAFTTDFAGLKVVIGEGECQLERQRRLKTQLARQTAKGERTVKVKYGVDEDVCSGDHSCIRLSGCPTLTLKDSSDPLKVDPVATVIEGCVGCGLCGENAHAATLCPSFYRAEIIRNPGWRDRFGASLRGLITRWMQPA
jgi:indolepyruvate ferredoxin oxidoreductase alpha subunit